jgi:type I restriction enzyme M protein
MTEQDQKQLGSILWSIADQLRGAMNADDFRDYMLSFLFLRYLSDNYEVAARKELGEDYPDNQDHPNTNPLQLWYEKNPDDIGEFEKQMRRKVHYVIKPEYLWGSIAEMARTQNEELLETLQKGFNYIETESFASTFAGLFSEINLDSEKLGKKYSDRNAKLCTIITKIAEGLTQFSTNSDTLGDAYEYLLGQFAAGSGKKAGEFYTPQQISSILSAIVVLDSQEPTTGKRTHLNKVLDFACGSGSLLLNVRRQLGPHGIGKIYGQEKNITTYNLARMNMLLHGVKDAEFEIFHGDTLLNDWEMLKEDNPAKKPYFDAVVANPPFSYRWEPPEAMGEDVRFKNYGLAPKSAADFAFLLHGFHYLAS